MSLIKSMKKSIAAGMMIAIGSIAKLSCENNLVGTLLFSIGLFSICYFDFYLYTGKIGYILSDEGFQIKDYFCIWVGNLIGCLIMILPYRILVDDKANVIDNLMTTKLAQAGLTRATLGFMCGMIMYIAITNFKMGESDFVKVFGIVICVSTFITAGFEHSIADICYSIFFVNSLEDFISVSAYIVDISIWNGIGSIFMRTLKEKKYE